MSSIDDGCSCLHQQALQTLTALELPCCLRPGVSMYCQECPCKSCKIQDGTIVTNPTLSWQGFTSGSQRSATGCLQAPGAELALSTALLPSTTLIAASQAWACRPLVHFWAALP